MTTAWTADLATGVDVIDEQHRELFDRAQRFQAALESRASTMDLLRLLGFLGDYVTTHFSYEESLMAACGYGRLAEHAAEHAAFTAAFRELRDDFAMAGVTPELEHAVDQQICAWLAAHVGNADRAMAAFVRSAPRDERPTL
jgi:hemerythrin